MPQENNYQLTRQVLEGKIQVIIDQFIIERRSRNLSPRTIQFYQEELKRFCAFCESNKVIIIADITPDIIRQFITKLGITRNQGGVHSGYKAIRAMLLWYEEEFEPDNWKNPIRKVKVPRGKIKPLPGISLADVGKLLDACEGKTALRDRAILLCLLDTGARRAEVIALSIKDVDLLTGAMVIRHGKGDKQRTVYLGRKSKKALRAYLKTRAKLEPDEPLFATIQGTRFTIGYLQIIIRYLAKIAGIHCPGLHDFRRACALDMYKRGVDLLAISGLLGHSSLEVTRKYIDNKDDDLRKAHEKGSPVDNSDL